MESIKDITDTMKNSNLTCDEKIRFLRLHRYKLLEEIHKKQQVLDQIDYCIYEIEEMKN
ncbi:MAG: hypothetical protein ACLUFN_00905 [Eubacterium sp.]